MKYCVTIFLFSLKGFFSFAQLQESIHIHTDKNIYLPGETIWLKAYVVQANKPTETSTNFYAAIYTNDGKLIEQKKFPIISGSTAGEFVIPDSIVSAGIRLLAKTRHSSALYEKYLALHHKGKQLEFPEAVESMVPRVGIYAENSRPAFNLNNHFSIYASVAGTPAKVSGVLYNTQHELIDSFYTGNDGFAKFQLLPRDGSSYYSEWKDEKGTVGKTMLPLFTDAGIVLHTEQANNQLFYNIQLARTGAVFQSLYLQIVNGIDTIYTSVIQPKDQLNITSSVPLDSFPAGLARLQLLDASKNILQQKNIFIEHPRQLPAVASITKSFEPKGKNIIEINNALLPAYDLSVSVTALPFYNEKINAGFADDIWLATAGGNKLYNAIAHKESAFLQKIIATLPVRDVPAEGNSSADNYLEWNIHYQDKNKGLPKGSKANFILADKTGKKQFYSLDASSATSFNAAGLIVYDSAKAYFSLINDNTQSEKLLLSATDNMQMPASISVMLTKSATDASDINTTKQTVPLDQYEIKAPGKFNELQTIKEVVVKSKKVNPITQRLLELEDKYTSGLSKGLARGFQLNVIDDPNADLAVDIFTYLSTRLGMKMTGTIASRALSDSRGGPLLFIDDTESLWSMLETYQVSHLAYVKLIHGIVVTPVGVSTTGVLYVYTKKANDYKTEDKIKMKTALVKGYDSNKAFVLPDYSDKQSLAGSDYRSTLYWNPYLNADGKTSLRIEYYNNDIAGKHLLTIKGFDAEGNPVEIRRILE